MKPDERDPAGRRRKGNQLRHHAGGEKLSMTRRRLTLERRDRAVSRGSPDDRDRAPGGQAGRAREPAAATSRSRCPTPRRRRGTGRRGRSGGPARPAGHRDRPGDSWSASATSPASVRRPGGAPPRSFGRRRGEDHGGTLQVLADALQLGLGRDGADHEDALAAWHARDDSPAQCWADPRSRFSEPRDRTDALPGRRRRATGRARHPGQGAETTAVGGSCRPSRARHGEQPRDPRPGRRSEPLRRPEHDVRSAGTTSVARVAAVRG